MNILSNIVVEKSYVVLEESIYGPYLFFRMKKNPKTKNIAQTEDTSQGFCFFVSWNAKKMVLLTGLTKSIYHLEKQPRPRLLSLASRKRDNPGDEVAWKD